MQVQFEPCTKTVPHTSLTTGVRDSFGAGLKLDLHASRSVSFGQLPTAIGLAPLRNRGRTKVPQKRVENLLVFNRTLPNSFSWASLGRCLDGAGGWLD